MSPPAIQSLRRQTGFMRLTAALVLIAFTLLVLLPAEKAARQAPVPPAPVAMAAAGPAPDFLAALRDSARRARDATGEGPSREADRQRLRQAEAGLDAEEREAEAGFAEVERHLQEHGLPAEIMQRHQAAVAEYRARAGELRIKLRAFREAQGRGDEAGSQRALNDLAEFLDRFQKTPPHQPFDPHNLPFRTPEEQVRPPRESKEELNRITRPQPPVKVAAAELTPGLLAQAEPGETPSPEDLAETEDVQLTPALRAKAEALHRNPVEIVNWVRNTVEFLPTYGSIQGADLTLQTRRGNAFDTASLLIALLRASGIPARYVYGTVQLPAEQVMNWVGGVKTPEAAQSLLGQGGIPSVGLVAGGRIVAFKLEHVWVEAYVDYIPSRGAVHRQGDTWVALDGSFKQYEFPDFADFTQAPPFEAKTIIDRAMADATISLPQGWIANINPTTFEESLRTAEDQTRAWLDHNLTNGKDWRRKQVIIGSELPILAGTLSYAVIARGSAYSALPASQRLSFGINLYESAMDRSNESPIFEFRSSLPKLAGKRLTLGFEPAGDADWKLIRSYLPTLPVGRTLTPADLPSSLPGYLIRLTGMLLLDDLVVARGGTFTMGDDVYSKTRMSRLSGGFNEAENSHIAGEILAIGMDLQGYSEHQLEKNPNRSAISVFHQTSVAFFHARDTRLEFLRLLGQAVGYPVPSFGFFGTRFTPRYNFGIATQVRINGSLVDIDASTQTLVALDNNATTKARLVYGSGLALSAMEHAIPEMYLANASYSGEGVSAVKVLSVALAQGQRLYSVNPANLATVLAQTQLSFEVETDIRNAVAAGQIAFTHERPVTVGQWIGAGYILIDPRTGAGAYRIAGGLNGGFMANEVATAMAFSGLSVMAFSGLSVMAGSAQQLLELAIPAAHADDGVCGEGERIRAQTSDLATQLMAGLLTGMAWNLLDSSDSPDASSETIHTLSTLIEITHAAAAVTQAKNDQCYIYYVGSTDQKGNDISELQAHIASAIGGTIPGDLTYSPSKVQKASGISRSWYNLGKYVGELAESPCGVPSARNGKQCDEYPFFSTLEGGPVRYKEGKVSLRLVNPDHNRNQGSTLGGFYRGCFRFANGTAFVVKPGGSTHGEAFTKASRKQCWPRAEIPDYVPESDDNQD